MSRKGEEGWGTGDGGWGMKEKHPSIHASKHPVPSKYPSSRGNWEAIAMYWIYWMYIQTVQTVLHRNLQHILYNTYTYSQIHIHFHPHQPIHPPTDTHMHLHSRATTTRATFSKLRTYAYLSTAPRLINPKIPKSIQSIRSDSATQRAPYPRLRCSLGAHQEAEKTSPVGVFGADTKQWKSNREAGLAVDGRWMDCGWTMMG